MTGDILCLTMNSIPQSTVIKDMSTNHTLGPEDLNDFYHTSIHITKLP